MKEKTINLEKRLVYKEKSIVLPIAPKQVVWASSSSGVMHAPQSR